MIYFKWFLLLFVNLLTKYFVAWPLTPIVVLFAKRDGNLPHWLYWFGTPDNTLDGDTGWRTENMPYRPDNERYQRYIIRHHRYIIRHHRYINRCFWLWRNSLYGFSEQVLGIKYNYDTDTLVIVGDPAVSNGPPGRSGLVRRYLYRNGDIIAFQWYYIRQYKRWPTKCIRINSGWKLWSFHDDITPSAHFVFSPSPSMHFKQ